MSTSTPSQSATTSGGSSMDATFSEPASETCIPGTKLKKDKLYVCLDIEAMCRMSRDGSRRVSELGFAILDTGGLKGRVLGDRGQNLFALVEQNATLFAIKDNKHHGIKHALWCAEKFPDVNPAKFLFGEPEWLWSGQVRYRFVQRVKAARAPGQKVEFVFFAKHNDVDWLKILSIDLRTEFPNCDIVDAQHLKVGRWVGDHLRKQQCSAGDYFTALGVPFRNAHNAANDAVFELQAYIAELCLTAEQEAVLSSGGNLPQIDRTPEQQSLPVLQPEGDNDELFKQAFPSLPAVVGQQQSSVASVLQPTDANAPQPPKRGRKGKTKYLPLKDFDN